MEFRSQMESMERLKDKKIIVTGGTGFIGGHLVEELINQGADILVIDIVCHKNSYFNKQLLKKKTLLKLIDISEKEKIRNVFKKFNPDFVFHLAAEAIVEDSYSDPYKTFQTNVMGTVSVLEACRSLKKIKGIIVASSDKAYGKTKNAYTESSPLQGDHPYDVSKSCTDLISQAYFKTYGLPVAITRFGNVYGEGDVHLNRIIPGICEAILKNKILMIRSNGKYVRDYVYVKDVVSGYIFILKNIKKTVGEAFNFSSNDSYSVLGLIKYVEKILKVKIKYKIQNSTRNEIPYQHLNDNKIRALGWRSAYNLKENLTRTLEWYRQI